MQSISNDIKNMLTTWKIHVIVAKCEQILSNIIIMPTAYTDLTSWAVYMHGIDVFAKMEGQ